MLSRVARSLWNDQKTSLTVVLTLAVGSAALIAALAMADAALWRQVPLPDPDRVAVIYGSVATPSTARSGQRWSYPRIVWLQEKLRTVDAVATFTPATVTLSSGDAVESIRGEVVSAPYFRVVATAPARGRVFTPEENRSPGAHPVVVIGHELWRRAFAQDTAVLRRTLRINDHAVTVLGVMPPGFRGLSDRGEIWIPSAMAPRLTYPEYLTTPQDFITAVVRLRAGQTIDALQAELRQQVPILQRVHPAEDTDSLAAASGTAVSLNEARISGGARRGARLVLGAMFLLHLLACANVVNLLLARAVSKRREAAVTLALGCPPRTLLWSRLLEAMLLCATAGALGSALAAVALRRLAPFNPLATPSGRDHLGPFADLGLDWRFVPLALAVVLFTALVVSWLPARAAITGNPLSAMRDGAHGTAAHGLSLRRVGPGGLILAVEAALALVLVASASLLVESYRRIRATPTGVDGARVLTFELGPPEAAVPPSRAPAFIDEVLAAVRAVPGVVSASVDGGAPLAGSASAGLHVAGQPEHRTRDAPVVLRHYVGDEHFRTLGIAVLRGRAFTQADRAGHERVVVINEAAVRRYFPGRDPVGQRVWFDGSTLNHPDSTGVIVGVVGDVRYDGFERVANPASFYTPYAQFTYGWRVYFVRTAGDPVAALPAVREAVRRAAPAVPMRNVMPLDELMATSWRRQRGAAWLFGAFALVAALLAASGIAAVVAHSTTRRSREMSVRLALGSTTHGLVRHVVREGMTFPLIGLGVGLAATAAASRVLGAFLFDIRPTHPGVLLLATLALLTLAALACLLPALRAARLDPMHALRSD